MTKIPIEHPSKPIVVHLPITLVEALDDAAHAQRISRSQLIRIALREHIGPITQQQD